MIKKQIPNFITLANLLCGCIAVSLAQQGDLITASSLIFIGGTFDFLDGFAARLLKVHSELGKQLDSLADLVSFGLAPAFIAQQLLIRSDVAISVSYIPFIIPLFSAYRLAKFNIDPRQTSTFIGLPTPANALVWASLPFFEEIGKGNILWKLVSNSTFDFLTRLFLSPAFLIGSCFLLSFLLIVELPLLSMKIKNYEDKENIPRGILFLLSLLLFLFFSFSAFPLIILLYISISILYFQLVHSKETITQKHKRDEV